MFTIPTEINTSYGYDFTDGEALVDTAYDNLIKILSMFPDRKRGYLEGMVYTDPKKHKQRRMSPFNVMLNGLYILGAKRPQWEGYFDVNVDELPNKASVAMKAFNCHKNFSWVNVNRLNKLPKGVWAGGKSRSAAAIYQLDINALCNFGSEDRELLSSICYFLIDKDGSIVTTQEPGKDMYWDSDNSLVSHRYGSAALSMIADSKYVWNVECWDGHTDLAKVIFGIEMEEVKSLMFARDLPMTATGRKRPILHWVKAHQRRIDEGIEVDVRKHMRGITEFKMGDLQFKITSPIKTPGEVYK